MIQAIIFDCDGVLVDSEFLLIDLEIKMLKEIGLNYDFEQFRNRFLGVTDSTFKERLNEDYNALYQKPLPDGFFSHLETHLINELKQNLCPVLGISDFISSLSLPKAVASNSGYTWLLEKLHLTNLHGHFNPHIYAGEMVQRGKPAPDLFLMVADKLGVSPENCLVIEDSANGVKGAKAAGMKTVGFLGGRHCNDNHGLLLTKAGADTLCTSADELAQHLI